MIKYNKNILNKLYIKNIKKDVYIFEMFMRDGLQSLPTIYSLDHKISFLNNIYNSNIRNIEFGSTTNEKLLPQMSNSFELWNYISENYNDKSKFTMLISDKKSLINKDT